jgi:hypothetical protein
MTKSPLRQPGAIEQARPAVRNLANQDWNEGDNEEEDEDYEIGERKLSQHVNVGTLEETKGHEQQNHDDNDYGDEVDEEEHDLQKEEAKGIDDEP